MILPPEYIRGLARVLAENEIIDKFYENPENEKAYRAWCTEVKNDERSDVDA